MIKVNDITIITKWIKKRVRMNTSEHVLIASWHSCLCQWPCWWCDFNGKPHLGCRDRCGTPIQKPTRDGSRCVGTRCRVVGSHGRTLGATLKRRMSQYSFSQLYGRSNVFPHMMNILHQIPSDRQIYWMDRVQFEYITLNWSLIQILRGPPEVLTGWRWAASSTLHTQKRNGF